MLSFDPSKIKIVQVELISEWMYKMKSGEFLKIWENCDTPAKVKNDIRKAPDEELIKCLNGTVGEKWNQNNTDAKCIYEKLPLSNCKTTVEQESGSI